MDKKFGHTGVLDQKTIVTYTAMILWEIYTNNRKDYPEIKNVEDLEGGKPTVSGQRKKSQPEKFMTLFMYLAGDCWDEFDSITDQRKYFDDTFCQMFLESIDKTLRINKLEKQRNRTWSGEHTLDDLAQLIKEV